MPKNCIKSDCNSAALHLHLSCLSVDKKMKTVFQPKIEIDPKKEDLELLRLGIDENNILITGESTGNQDITFFISNADNEIIGGIRGTYNISVGFI